MRIDGVYFDGKTSKSSNVRLSFDTAGNMNISGGSVELDYPFKVLKFSPRIGNTARNIFLPDGGKCETLANDEIDHLLISQRQGLFSLILHGLENRLVYVLFAAMITVFSGWAFVTYGIPSIAKKIAFSLPVKSDIMLSDHSLDVLDRFVFSATKLPDQVRQRLQNRFSTMVSRIDDSHPFRLEFRDSPALGANAFALPSGLIVITDQLVELATNDQELISIFAHEMGHVKYRHGLRTVLQSSSVVLMISWMTGDLSTISAMSAALPAKLIEAKYSRKFETEADNYARDYLIENKIPLHFFSDILTRLEAEHPSGADSANFLSSHPATGQRIKDFASGRDMAQH